MATYKRGGMWWYEFIIAGKRVRESCGSTSKTVAKEAEQRRRRELERAALGLPTEARAVRVKSVSEVLKEYAASYGLNHRPKSVTFVNSRFLHVNRLLGNKLLSDMTEKTIREYMKTRRDEGASGRTVNSEVGELTRAVGLTWKALWPKLRKLEERKDIGQALSPAEERALLDSTGEVRSPIIGAFVRIALLTGMRAGEILSLTWGQVDLERFVITVGRAKTAAGTGRQIPIGRNLFAVLSAHAEWFTGRFGAATPSSNLFPYGSPYPSDPARPTTTIKHAWERVRARAGIHCRLHDLRHTAATKMAEAGVPESTMLALMGHMSRAMLERYSHIRMDAKRLAVDTMSLHDGVISGLVPTNSPTIETALVVQ